jgi:hypothetical protein
MTNTKYNLLSGSQTMKIITRTLITLSLLFLLAYQSVTAAQYLSSRYKSKFLSNRDLDAVIRSADASYGGEIAGNISNLRDVIPEQAIVLIPPGPGSGAPFNDAHLMQYFLFPRRIVTCPFDCIGLINDPEVFIIAQDDFPPTELIPLSKQYDAINEHLGIYHPVK